VKDEITIHRQAIADAFDELVAAMNRVAGCSLLSMRTNPDLMKMVDGMRDAEFKLAETLEKADIL
jgi:quinol monooxygenase YgiN